MTDLRRPTRLLVGGYAGTDTPSAAVHGVALDNDTGLLGSAESVADVPNAFHLVLSPSGRTVYAASNVADGRLHVLRLGAGGSVTRLASRSTEGAGPVHVAVHPAGRHLLVANHDSGTVAVFEIGVDETVGKVTDVVQHKGSGPNPMGQAGPHPHAVVADPTGAWLLVPDKGDDHVHVYQLDVAAGKLVAHGEHRIGSGVGPRGLVFHPDGEHVYVVGELDCTVTVCRWDGEAATLSVLSTVSTLPPGVQSWNAPSALVMSPDGRHVFVGNRGHESIAVFAVRPGGLELLGHHQLGVPVTTLPWDLALHPDGDLLFAVNQLAGTLVTMHVDGASLETAGEPVAVPHPACILLV
jgi:6-phosphogluconolactonase